MSTKNAINSLMEMVSIFFMENIMRRSTPSTYAEVAIEVLASAGSR